MSGVFVDSSGWIALLSPMDRHRADAATAYRKLRAARARMFTNNYVVDETATRLRYDLGLEPAIRFREGLARSEAQRELWILWIDESAEAAAWEILQQYADVKLSLTDATVAVSARTARTAEILTLDAGFGALGFTVLLPR